LFYFFAFFVLSLVGKLSLLAKYCLISNKPLYSFPQGERLIKLNQIAIQQMRILGTGGSERKLLK
jgi:hypothetical protein